MRIAYQKVMSFCFYDLRKQFIFFNICNHAAFVFILPHGCCL